MSLLLCGSCIGCRSQRIQYKLCLLVHTIFVGHAPDYIASLLMPASDILSRSSLRSSSNCDLVLYQERVGRLVTGLSLLPHPVLGIGCRLTWNPCLRLLHSRKNWRVLFFCLHREHCVNSGMRHWSACRGRTTSHCCYSCHSLTAFSRCVALHTPRNFSNTTFLKSRLQS